MQITFDAAKSAKNLAERNLSFERVAEPDWETAIAEEDRRFNYGERRFQVTGTLDGRPHAVVVTYRRDAVHVISFRRANKREIKRYEEAG